MVEGLKTGSERADRGFGRSRIYLEGGRTQEKKLH